jgi:hypothetical protein
VLITFNFMTMAKISAHQVLKCNHMFHGKTDWVQSQSPRCVQLVL